MPQIEHLPLLRRKPEEIVAWRNGKGISAAEFLGDVAQCANGLPAAEAAVVACRNPYLFTVGFCAVLSKGQCNILPSNHSPRRVAATLADHPHSYLLHDDCITPNKGSEAYPIEALCNSAKPTEQVPEIPADQIAAIVYTSGSTGKPVRLTKTWHTLVIGARINSSTLAEKGVPKATCVTTVPPWHMYGLEWSVMAPLIHDICVFSGNSFFPADVLAALETAAAPRWLLTTPVHLRALIGANLQFPPVAMIMCATAPLAAEVAGKAEELMSANLLEIYGCSEAGSIAYRLTTKDPLWTFFDSFKLTSRDDPVSITAAHLDQEVELSDILAFEADDRFRIAGRHEDFVKVGGNRASLQELSKILTDINGVDDGVFFEHGSNQHESRLAACAVCPGLTIEQLTSALAERIDPVFMPRPLRLVNELPREPSGKLPRARLMDLLKPTDAQPTNHE